MVLCFVLLLSSIHYMYDYIKNEFTETREVPTFNDYIKKDIYNKETSLENPKREKGEKQMRKEKTSEKTSEKANKISSENEKEKQHVKDKDIKEEENKIEKEEKEEKTKDMLSTEQDYTPIYQLKKPIEETVDHTVSSIPIIPSVDHVEDKKETSELDDYFKSLH